jgi:hypothetical protein
LLGHKPVPFTPSEPEGGPTRVHDELPVYADLTGASTAPTDWAIVSLCRTGFVLKAWAMRRHGWSEAGAHAWLVRSWDRVHTKNPVFARVLREEWQ